MTTRLQVAILILVPILIVACDSTPTPTLAPRPTATPVPVKVEFVTPQLEREAAALSQRIANECVETPERAVEVYTCNGMRQVISIKRSQLGGSRAGVPIYLFRLNGSAIIREVTLAEARLKAKNAFEQADDLYALSRTYKSEEDERGGWKGWDYQSKSGKYGHEAGQSLMWGQAWQEVERMILNYERRRQ